IRRDPPRRRRRQRRRRRARRRRLSRRRPRPSMKRRHETSHESHDRWLVSYADFITLLFAFFVVMFASTQSDKAKAKAVSESVKDALEHGEMSNVIATVLGQGRHENARS